MKNEAACGYEAHVVYEAAYGHDGGFSRSENRNGFDTTSSTASGPPSPIGEGQPAKLATAEGYGGYGRFLTSSVSFADSCSPTQLRWLSKGEGNGGYGGTGYGGRGWLNLIRHHLWRRCHLFPHPATLANQKGKPTGGKNDGVSGLLFVIFLY